jgi:hypothetical protein
MRTFKRGDRCAGLWPDHSIHDAVVVAELTQAALYRSNRCSVVTVPWLIVRVSVGIASIVVIRITPSPIVVARAAVVIASTALVAVTRIAVLSVVAGTRILPRTNVSLSTRIMTIAHVR